MYVSKPTKNKKRWEKDEELEMRGKKRLFIIIANAVIKTSKIPSFLPPLSSLKNAVTFFICHTKSGSCVLSTAMQL